MLVQISRRRRRRISGAGGIQKGEGMRPALRYAISVLVKEAVYADNSYNHSRQPFAQNPSAPAPPPPPPRALQVVNAPSCWYSRRVSLFQLVCLVSASCHFRTQAFLVVLRCRLHHSAIPTVWHLNRTAGLVATSG